ncbi:MAG: FixH family protein [Rhodoferax sp.]|uniref:FixH family protein n=1 Tax=Rhodoferax sp. TaxID=50421 RepID=UPI00260907E0|nr:FixH family protein [Rhodoferax sp.]MDD5335783.1 FixH family protein [Rhodoferax sp.]
MQNGTLDTTVPWWRFGHVWLIVAGPAIVVVASFITLYLAVTRPDPVVAEDYYRKGIDINKTLGKEASGSGLAPAMQARNHAATGVVPSANAVAKP